MTAALNRQKIRCPLPACVWELEFTPAEVPETALEAVFGRHVLTSVARMSDLERLEGELREHFAGHGTPEFVRALSEQSQEIERLKERASKYRRLLHPEPGDFVKGWIDEGGSAQGVLMSAEEFAAGTPVGDLPTYYAAIKTQPADTVVVVMRASLRGVEE